MKAQSFERVLRDVTPPPASAEARLRARRAAILEFELIHHATSQNAAPAVSSGRAPRRGTWRKRSVWFGSLAAACVVVVAVSVVWLMPAEHRHFAEQAPPIHTDIMSEVGNERPSVRPGSQVPADEQQPAPMVHIDLPVNRGVKPAANDDTRRLLAPPPAVPSAELANQVLSHSEYSGGRARANLRAQLEKKSSADAASASLGATMSSTPVVPEVAEITVAGSRRTEGIVTPSPVSGAQSAEADKTKSEGPLLESVIVTSAKKRSLLSRLFQREDRAEAETPAPVDVREKGRDKFEHFDVNSVKQVSEEPVSTFSADVDTSSYSFVRKQLDGGSLPQKDSVRVEEMINYFDYAWPAAESRERPFRPTVVVSDSPWGKGRKLVHIGIKGYELPARERPNANLVLLLDVSGSMHEEDKLPLVKQSMKLLLGSLKPTDTVAIVVYAGAAGQVLAPTPVSEKQKIISALDQLQAGGSTAGAEGIELAYELAESSFRKDGVNRILLCTDGDFNVGIDSTNELKGFVERKREKGVFLSVLGFGEGNYRDELAQALAQNGNGVAAYIDTLNEARKVLVQEASASLFTIAKDVKLQVEFNPATVAEYRLIGYETRALKREDFNNDAIDAGDIGAGHAVTAIYEITPVGGERMVDESRYAKEDGQRSGSGKGSEYGFLKIRYKLPNESRSKLIEQPISIAQESVPESIARDVQFSTAVAGFAQLLRGGSFTGSLSYDDVIKQALASRGDDAYGYRNEFVQLVRKAQVARGM